MPTETNSPINQLTPQQLSAMGGIAQETSGFLDTTDPLAENYQANMMASSAAQGLAMGSSLGPIGMGVGVVGGAIYGAVTADEQIEKAKKQKEISTGFDTRGKAMENELNMMNQEVYPNEDLVNKYSSSPKALTQMQGTVAHNMSARQYNENQKMNALAMNGIPAALTLKDNQYEK
jgi:hypothetical protein